MLAGGRTAAILKPGPCVGARACACTSAEAAVLPSTTTECAMIERMAQSALGGSSSRVPQRLLHAVETYAARDPVRATLKGLVHHGRHVRSKFVSHHLRDQVGGRF